MLSSLMYLQQSLRLNRHVTTLQQLAADVRHKSAPRPLDKSSGVLIPRLPDFSSAELVDTVNQIAIEIGMPVDEISYRLEEGANPYLRYRVTLSAVASYPLMRRFVDQMAMQLPHAVLDEISCSRDDIAAAALGCDLSFSAFFRKDSRG